MAFPGTQPQLKSESLAWGRDWRYLLKAGEKDERIWRKDQSYVTKTKRVEKAYRCPESIEPTKRYLEIQCKKNVLKLIEWNLQTKGHTRLFCLK